MSTQTVSCVSVEFIPIGSKTVSVYVSIIRCWWLKQAEDKTSRCCESLKIIWCGKLMNTSVKHSYVLISHQQKM